MRAALDKASLAVAGYVGRSIRALPATACLATGVVGSFILWGFGVSLLVASAFLFVIDRRI